MTFARMAEAFAAGESCSKQAGFALLAIATARPGHAPDREVTNLDKNPVFHYTFHHETAIQTTSRGRVPQSPEKRFPINELMANDGYYRQLYELLLHAPEQ